MADNDAHTALVSLLRDALDPEEFEAACSLLDVVINNPAAPVTDRKLTSDSFAWVQREGRRLEQRSHIESEKKRPATTPSVMALDGRGTDTMVDRDTIKAWQAIQAAERETGITGKASADATYAAALKQMGMDTAGLAGHANAARSVYNALKSKRMQPRGVALDAKAASARAERFPHAGRLLTPFS